MSWLAMDCRRCFQKKKTPRHPQLVRPDHQTPSHLGHGDQDVEQDEGAALVAEHLEGRLGGRHRADRHGRRRRGGGRVLMSCRGSSGGGHHLRRQDSSRHSLDATLASQYRIMKQAEISQRSLLRGVAAWIARLTDAERLDRQISQTLKNTIDHLVDPNVRWIDERWHEVFM